MKKALQIAGSLVVVLFLIGVVSRHKAVPSPAPTSVSKTTRPAAAAAAAAAEAVASPVAHEYPSTMVGQLDRCHDSIRDRTFGGATASEMELWDEHIKDVARLAEIIDSTGSKTIDPRTFLKIAITAQREVDYYGGLTYEMLKKNSERYAGRAWFMMNAKILEIFEHDGRSIARIEMDPGRHPIAVEWRYLTNFVAGDRVDLIGFWSGDFEYKARIGDLTIPGLAAAGVFKPGTINALNRIQKVWKGELPSDQLRSVARKL